MNLKMKGKAILCCFFAVLRFIFENHRMPKTLVLPFSKQETKTTLCVLDNNITTDTCIGNHMISSAIWNK